MKLTVVIAVLVVIGCCNAEDIEVNFYDDPNDPCCTATVSSTTTVAGAVAACIPINALCATNALTGSLKNVVNGQGINLLQSCGDAVSTVGGTQLDIEID